MRTGWPWLSNPLVSWDDGIRWYVDEVAGATEWPIDAQFVIEQHLKLPSETPDSDYIDRLIATATRQAERFTKRAIASQTLAMQLSGFPTGYIEIQRPPLIEVVSIGYTDESGAAQTVSGFQTQAQRGPNARRSIVAPAAGGSWPSTSSDVPFPVTVTYRAGYVTADSPEQINVPEDITHGILLVIAELYKQRSESVIGVGATISPGVVRARDLWLPYRIF